MKRKVLSLVIILALCLNVCPVWTLAAGQDEAAVQSNGPGNSSSPYILDGNRPVGSPQEPDVLDGDLPIDSPKEIVTPYTIDTNGFTLTGSRSTAILVTSTGSLQLIGKVVSLKDAGVEVQSGGILVTEPGIYIRGSTYALKIASGAVVQLSPGTYIGKQAAIYTEEGDFSGLLAKGCAYLDENNNPIPPDNLANVRTLVVGPCGHPDKTYTPNPGAPTHTWTCPCQETGSEKCTFTFSGNTGTCDICKRTLTITVDEASLDLVYDGTDKTADVIRAVTLDGGTTLAKDTDYTVDCTPRTDVGEITVTVTGVTFNGTFSKTYQVTQDRPGITWDMPTKELDYDGRRTSIEGELPHITINIKAPNTEDLHPKLKYSYRTHGTSDPFTDGLPLGAGKYEVKAYLKESQNYAAAETNPCLTLTIKTIDPVTTPPAAQNLTFNRAAQELVTPGALDPRAVGAQILFATSQNGEYSTAIPTGTDAKDYEVWYKVEGTGNYNAAGPAQIANVKIQRKPITPLVVLSQTSYLYNGEYKQPQVTVKDKDGGVVLLETEYQVAYVNNRDVSTAGNPAKVVVTDQTGGNYAITQVEVPFEITASEQSGLSIIQKPNTVTYGDKFTLGTSGGSGNGAVTWAITRGNNVATVDASSGQVTVIGVGKATVTATKSGAARAAGNYEDATDSWEFTAVKKPITATVTAEDKTYDGTNTATLHAVVAQSDQVSGNVITITDPTGTFSDANAGTDKTVTVTGTPTVSGNHPEYYEVSYSSTTVKATIHKADAAITAPGTATLTYNGTEQALLGTRAAVSATPDDGTLRAEYALSKDGPYSTDYPKATQAGTYTVWYRVRENPNYAAPASQSVEVTILKQTVTSPTVTLDPPSSVYSGAPQEPAVTLKDGGNTIPAGEYTAAYSNNTNAGTATVTVTARPDGNYSFTPISQNFIISPKDVTPTVELAESSFSYDGAKKTPQLTLRDGGTVIGPEQYEVTWTDDKGQTGDHVLRAVGIYTGTITNVANGNYLINTTATVEITKAAQAALKITGQPERVCYGDTVRLGTEGGTDEGTVKWSIPASVAGITIDPGTGVLTVHGTGTATVKAVRTVPNYGDVSAEWTFTVQPKPVTAVVTVTAKDYDGTIDVAPSQITATVNPGDWVDPSESFSLNGLTGTYDTANAGKGKTVTLNDAGATKADGSGKYAVSYPAAATGDITAKHVTVTVTLSDHDLNTDASGKYYFFDGAEKRPAVTVTANDNGAALTDSDYSVTYTDNKNVGTNAAVTVTAKASGNYTFNPETVNFEIRSAGAALTQTPQAKDLSYIKGTAQELVTVGSASGGTVVYALKSGNTEPADASYSTTIPTGTNAGTYTVYYKVQGDANHTGTAPAQVSVTIKPREFTPVITLSQTSCEYNGSAHEPTATVKDGTDVIGTSEYTVTWQNNVNAGTATAVVSDNNGGNYIVNGTADFQITKKAPAVTAPTAISGLQYTGADQALVKAGVCNDGTVVYSVNGGSYSAALPTASVRGTYKIDWRVLGDANHSDTAPVRLPDVVIDKHTVTNPAISLSSDRFPYNGKQQRPVITVYDKSGRVIPEHEYTVAITGTGGNNGMVNIDTYTITITPSANSNYDIQITTPPTFEIVAADQETISITNTKGQVYYGDVIPLNTEGGSGSGTVTWSITGHTKTELTPAGLLTVKDINAPITVTATRSRDNYADVTATWTFTPAKKPVTAVLTGVDKPYDGNVNAAIRAEIAAKDRVSGDTITITGLTGVFDNPNVGTNKTVTKNSTPTVSGTNSDKYDITYPAAATASILPVAATVTAPNPKTLTYDASKAQELVTAGGATGGTIVYSLDGTNFTQTIPTAKDAGNYTVYYKAAGDGNHTDSVEGTVPVSIAQQTVTPNIELNPPSAQYNGNVQQPQVTVRDSTSNLIPVGEYAVVYETGTNWMDKGNHKVTVKNVTGGNYKINDKQATFTINETVQSPLSINGRPARVQYGDAPFTLTAVGGSGTGAVTWKSSDTNIAEIDGNGVVTIKKAGSVTITATREADANHDKVSVGWTFTVEQKPVSASVTVTGAGPFQYTNSAHEPAVTVVVDGRTLDAGEYSTAYSNNTDAGTAKVTVESTSVCNYQFSASTTFTIDKGQAEYSSQPQGLTNLTYTGNPLTLVNGGSTNFGEIQYKVGAGGTYSTSVSAITGINAGDYTVYYKVEGTDNFGGIAEQSVPATIAKANPISDPNPTASGTQGQKLSELTVSGVSIPGTFAWTAGDDYAPGVGSDNYEVTFTPTDTTNYETVTVQVQVTISSSTPSGGGGGGGSSSPSGGTSTPSAEISSTPSENAVSMSMPASVKNGAASAAVTAADGAKLAKAAAAQKSPSVVIKPEISGSVTKAEVAIPASTVKQIKDETSAALTVSTPIAETTIPQTALDTLGSAGGTVNVAAEQVDQGVALTLTAGGKKVDSVPGGVTLSVPAEDAGPGTVAVLVHEDGTRETIRKSVAADGKVNIPLDGSATVEIVDNSKEFADVAPTSWASDAVAFASAHELFNGTSETTFSPEDSMSRGMLATVLYNLEGQPDQNLTVEDLSSGYSDVSGDAWYADGIAWAAENGIVNGYGNGEFGPDDSVTREQFAVMLWKYAGSPEADGQALSFTDADQASGYARKALCWAVENGILSGYGDGRLAPGETATRAEAAQILKNFMERT